MRINVPGQRRADSKFDALAALAVVAVTCSDVLVAATRVTLAALTVKLQREIRGQVLVILRRRSNLKRRRAPAVSRQRQHINLGHGNTLAKHARVGEYTAILDNKIMARENQISRRLALTSACVNVTADQMRALLRNQLTTVRGLAGQRGRRGQVADQRSAGDGVCV